MNRVAVADVLDDGNKRSGIGPDGGNSDSEECESDQRVKESASFEHGW